ncbi:MAG: hypothetical protein ACTHO8_00515 [Solirubrobacterales bacterium]
MPKPSSPAELVAELHRRQNEMSAGGSVEKPGEVLEARDAVAQLVAGSAALDGGRVSWQTVGVYRVDVEAGLIHEVWLVPLDGEPFDRIWSA